MMGGIESLRLSVSNIPSVKGYRYFAYNDHVVLLDLQTRKVATIVK